MDIVAQSPVTAVPSTDVTSDRLTNLYHFIISVIVLIGGGFMAYQGRSDGLAPAAIGAVLVFWFQRSSTSKALSALDTVSAKVIKSTIP